MGIWKNCTMTTLYYTNNPSKNRLCTVKLDDNRILIEYEEGEIVQYKGEKSGEGHFELNGVGFQGQASLHMFTGSQLLEGSWIEEGARGMWRIQLA